MQKNRVYTSNIIQVVPAGGFGNDVNFNINHFNREFKLKSIFFDIHLRYPNIGIQTLIPLEQNTTQYFCLTIRANIVGARFANNFEDLVETIPNSVQNNGTAIQLYKPGQVLFDSFFVANQLNVLLAYTNNDVLNDILYCANITIEIEPKI